MKKKLLIGILTVIICFTLIGCGKENNNNIDNKLKENNNSNQQPENNNNDEKPNNIPEYEIKSTDDRLVFVDPTGMNYVVYYFENGIMTEAEGVVKYPSIELANIAYNEAKSDDPNIDIKINGNFIIVKETIDDNIKRYTKDELESYLKMAGFTINK